VTSANLLKKYNRPPFFERSDFMQQNKIETGGARKYWIVAVCALMVCISLGFCSSNASLYLGPITDALHIKRSVFSLKESFRFIANAIINLFFGFLICKFGAKKLIAAGFACLISAVLLYATSTNVLGFYLGGTLLGIGFSWTTTTMVSYLVNRWFDKNRGTINGLILCANGLGGAIAAQIVTPIIYQKDNLFGYRDAYYLVAILLVIVGVLSVLVIGEPKGERPQTAGKKQARGGTWSGITLQQALRQPYFYAAAVGVFLTGMSLQGINGVGGAHLRDVGINTDFVATVLSLHSIILCGSKFFAGISYDKLGLRTTLLICQSFALISFVALALASSSAFGMGCAAVWAATSSLALPLETVMLPLITADLFGEKDFPKLVGIIVSLNVSGYAVGTPLVNLLFDLTGTYMSMLYIIVPTVIALMVAFVLIIRAAHKLRDEISKEESL
jgi:MFS family permease